MRHFEKMRPVHQSSAQRQSRPCQFPIGEWNKFRSQQARKSKFCIKAYFIGIKVRTPAVYFAYLPFVSAIQFQSEPFSPAKQITVRHLERQPRPQITIRLRSQICFQLRLQWRIKPASDLKIQRVGNCFVERSRRHGNITEYTQPRKVGLRCRQPPHIYRLAFLKCYARRYQGFSQFRRTHLYHFASVGLQCIGRSSAFCPHHHSRHIADIKLSQSFFRRFRRKRNLQHDTIFSRHNRICQIVNIFRPEIIISMISDSVRHSRARNRQRIIAKHFSHLQIFVAFKIGIQFTIKFCRVGQIADFRQPFRSSHFHIINNTRLAGIFLVVFKFIGCSRTEITIFIQHVFHHLHPQIRPHIRH